jgi:hypothetical protein
VYRKKHQKVDAEINLEKENNMIIYMNQEVESRLAKLENCCADYRTQIGELEERLTRTHEEVGERLHRFRQELVDKQEYYEFEKIKVKLDIRKRHITSGIDHVLDSLLIIDPPPHWGTTLLDKIYFQSYEGKNFELFDKLYDLYNEVKRMAQSYNESGKIELSEKFRLEAEHIFDELKQYEHMYQDKWLKLNTMRVPTAEAHSPLFSHPGGYKSYAKGGRKTRRNKKRNSFKK